MAWQILYTKYMYKNDLCCQVSFEDVELQLHATCILYSTAVKFRNYKFCSKGKTYMKLWSTKDVMAI